MPLFPFSLPRLVPSLAAAIAVSVAASPGAEARGFGPQPGSDLRPAFDKLAEFSVRDGRDLDIAEFPAGAEYAEARLCVGFGSIEMRGATLVYTGADGVEREERIRVKRLLRSGECSDPLKLRGAGYDPDADDAAVSDRTLLRLELKYSAYARTGPQPRVGVFAR
ncbi:MAG: hypothetical protein AAF909_00570 [Pseudomonadota bacterium]